MSTEIKKREAIDLNKALIIRGPQGEIRRIRSSLTLSEENRTLVQIIKGWNGKPGVWIPSATGYTAIGELCGLMPDPDVQEPYWKDSKTCYARVRIGGYTSLGQPVIIDKTVDYSVHRYNVLDLLAKAGYSEHANFFKIMPFAGEPEPGVFKGAPEVGVWAPYRLDDAMVLWIRTDGNPNLLKWQKEMVNRSKTALRTAQTFATRNAIAAHPAIPRLRQFNQPTATLSCVCWFAKEGNITFDMLEEHKSVEIIQDHQSIDHDEDATTIEGDAAEIMDPSEVADEEQEQGKPENRPMSHEEKKAHRNKVGSAVADLIDALPQAAVHQAFASCSIPDEADLHLLSTEQLENLGVELKTRFQARNRPEPEGEEC